jgi:hypothetical protein
MWVGTMSFTLFVMTRNCSQAGSVTIKHGIAKMKLYIRQSLLLLSPFIMLLAAIFLQACSLQPTLTPNQVHETAMAASLCTLADCFDNLLVKLTGESPADFIVRVEDEAGRVGAMQCFEDKQTASSVRHSTFNGYLLTAPESEKINELSPILGFCDSNNGYFNMLEWQDESLASVTVQCFEAEQRDFVNSSACWDDAVSFASFTPSELTISVYWNGKVKTETVRPVYESDYPNGENCEPECQGSVINIKLP